MLALDDVEELVLVLWNVEAGVERRDLLDDDAERPVRRVRSSPDDEVGAAEPKPLAAVVDEHEAQAGRRGGGRDRVVKHAATLGVGASLGMSSGLLDRLPAATPG
jgi:hypothetical protein